LEQHSDDALNLCYIGTICTIQTTQIDAYDNIIYTEGVFKDIDFDGFIMGPLEDGDDKERTELVGISEVEGEGKW
jgi:hypothetical protein